MVAFRWLMEDDVGNKARASEDFGTRSDAEAWMTDGWAELRAAGGKTVVLVSDGDRVVYRMSLEDAPKTE